MADKDIYRSKLQGELNNMRRNLENARHWIDVHEYRASHAMESINEIKRQAYETGVDLK